MNAGKAIIDSLVNVHSQTAHRAAESHLGSPEVVSQSISLNHGSWSTEMEINQVLNSKMVPLN